MNQLKKTYFNRFKISKKFVHAHAEVGRLLVEEATHSCDLSLHKMISFQKSVKISDF